MFLYLNCHSLEDAYAKNACPAAEFSVPAALGETETRIVEFDDFTLAVGADDLLLLGEEAGSSNSFKIFPHDHAEAASHPNILA